MKKLLLPIFGSVLLTSSASLIATSNVNTEIKITEKKQTLKEFASKDYKINNQSHLDEKQVKEIQIASHNWNNEEIDSILNQALEYHDHQVTINQDKLDFTKLPPEILNHLDLVLANLNNAVSAGYIQPYIINDNFIQLNYSKNTNATFNNSNDEIIYFENKEERTKIDNFSTVTPHLSIWLSAYGPSHWWKFWEWGGYIHFDEDAVQAAKVVKLVAELMSFVFFIKNIGKLQKAISELKAANSANNAVKIDNSLKDLSKILGDTALSIIGTISDILAVITAAIAFGLVLLTSGGWMGALLQLIISIIPPLVNEMLRADWGRGVKWQFANFVFPCGFSPE